MTNAHFLSNFAVAISSDRFRSYYPVGSQSEYEVLGNYAWNISLCESLYPALNGIEIALCNSIHCVATARFGTELWFDGQLKALEDDRLKKLRHKLYRSGIEAPVAGDYVAGLNLGFWVDLFKGRYEQVLWPWLLSEVFPNATKKQTSRERVFKRLFEIQKLRNRVFHHEPIWHLTDLEQQHGLILETIGWISPAVLAMTRMLDRFPSVYTMGPKRYTDELDFIAQN